MWGAVAEAGRRGRASPTGGSACEPRPAARDGSPPACLAPGAPRSPPRGRGRGTAAPAAGRPAARRPRAMTPAACPTARSPPARATPPPPPRARPHRSAAPPAYARPLPGPRSSGSPPRGSGSPCRQAPEGSAGSAAPPPSRPCRAVLGEARQPPPSAARRRPKAQMIPTCAPWPLPAPPLPPRACAPDAPATRPRATWACR